MGARRVLAAAAFSLTALSSTGCSSQATSSDCHSIVESGELPAWASTGFSQGARVPHVIGSEGQIAAIYFAGSLVASTSAEPVNKVLFVPRVALNGPAPLSIDARLNGTGDVVHRERADGPGPGVLDLPEPGCWRLSLRWGDQTDTMDLEYAAPSHPPARRY